MCYQEGRDRHAMLTKERLERLRNEADGRKKSVSITSRLEFQPER